MGWAPEETGTIPVLVLMLGGERRGEGKHAAINWENGRPGRAEPVQMDGDGRRQDGPNRRQGEGRRATPAGGGGWD